MRGVVVMVVLVMEVVDGGGVGGVEASTLRVEKVGASLLAMAVT